MAATVDVANYLSPYKRIPATVPGWDDGRQATWPASTATLVSCAGSAVLVDALMTVAEGEQLADWIGAAGLELTTVYDDATRVLDESRRYVRDFGDAVETSDGPDELITTMLAKHGGLGNPYTLWVAAHSQFGS